ncbi:8541_t:CDS:1, partial [Funneliformis mosseae]
PYGPQYSGFPQGPHHNYPPGESLNMPQLPPFLTELKNLNNNNVEAQTYDNTNNNEVLADFENQKYQIVTGQIEHHQPQSRPAIGFASETQPSLPTNPSPFSTSIPLPPPSESSEGAFKQTAISSSD